MATSLIDYNKKMIDVNDNVLLFSLFYLKETASKNDLPEWFRSFEVDVIDEMLRIRPIGWGFMNLDDYLTNDIRKNLFKSLIYQSMLMVENFEFMSITSETANQVLQLSKEDMWLENMYLDKIYIIEFYKKLIKLLE